METDNAKFIENGEVSGNEKPRNVVIQEARVNVQIPITSQNIVPTAIVQNDNVEEQINDNLPYNEIAINEPIVEEPQEIVLRRSQRERRSAISDDYVVYLQESDFDIRINKDPVGFSQAIDSADSNKWIDAMNDEMKSME